MNNQQRNEKVDYRFDKNDFLEQPTLNKTILHHRFHFSPRNK